MHLRITALTFAISFIALPFCASASCPQESYQSLKKIGKKILLSVRSFHSPCVVCLRPGAPALQLKQNFLSLSYTIDQYSLSREKYQVSKYPSKISGYTFTFGADYIFAMKLRRHYYSQWRPLQISYSGFLRIWLSQAFNISTSARQCSGLLSSHQIRGSGLKLENCSQASTAWNGTCSRAIDNNTNQQYEYNSCTHTSARSRSNAWWQARLTQLTRVQFVRIYNRIDSCCKDRLANFIIKVDGRTCATYQNRRGFSVMTFPCNLAGRVIRIENMRRGMLTLCEVQVFGKAVDPARASERLYCPEMKFTKWSRVVLQPLSLALPTSPQCQWKIAARDNHATMIRVTNPCVDDGRVHIRRYRGLCRREVKIVTSQNEESNWMAFNGPASSESESHPRELATCCSDSGKSFGPFYGNVTIIADTFTDELFVGGLNITVDYIGAGANACAVADSNLWSRQGKCLSSNIYLRPNCRHAFNVVHLYRTNTVRSSGTLHVKLVCNGNYSKGFNFMKILFDYHSPILLKCNQSRTISYSLYPSSFELLSPKNLSSMLSLKLCDDDRAQPLICTDMSSSRRTVIGSNSTWVAGSLQLALHKPSVFSQYNCNFRFVNSPETRVVLRVHTAQNRRYMQQFCRSSYNNGSYKAQVTMTHIGADAEGSQNAKDSWELQLCNEQDVGHLIKFPAVAVAGTLLLSLKSDPAQTNASSRLPLVVNINYRFERKCPSLKIVKSPLVSRGKSESRSGIFKLSAKISCWPPRSLSCQWRPFEQLKQNTGFAKLRSAIIRSESHALTRWAVSVQYQPLEGNCSQGGGASVSVLGEVPRRKRAVCGQTPEDFAVSASQYGVLIAACKPGDWESWNLQVTVIDCISVGCNSSAKFSASPRVFKIEDKAKDFFASLSLFLVMLLICLSCSAAVYLQRRDSYRRF